MLETAAFIVAWVHAFLGIASLPNIGLLSPPDGVDGYTYITYLFASGCFWLLVSIREHIKKGDQVNDTPQPGDDLTED